MLFATSFKLPPKGESLIGVSSHVLFPYSDLRLFNRKLSISDKVYKKYRPRNQFMMARQHLTSVIGGQRDARIKSGKISQVC